MLLTHSESRNKKQYTMHIQQKVQRIVCKDFFANTAVRLDSGILHGRLNKHHGALLGYDFNLCTSLLA
jgi:hypothetical protein